MSLSKQEASGFVLLRIGKPSAMAVQKKQDIGLTTTSHIEDGIDAWKKAGGAPKAILGRDAQFRVDLWSLVGNKFRWLAGPGLTNRNGR
jgi:hypothetical protein